MRPEEFRSDTISRLIGHYTEREVMSDENFNHCWAELDSVWRSRILGFYCNRGCSLERARELAAEVMLIVHRHFGQLSNASSFSGWIHRIAIRLQYKKRTFDPVDPVRNDPLFNLEDETREHDSLLEKAREQADEIARVAETKGLIVGALERLNEPYREIMKLRYVDGHSPELIAKVFNDAKIETVHVWLSRGRTKLKYLIAEAEKENL